MFQPSLIWVGVGTFPGIEFPDGSTKLLVPRPAQSLIPFPLTSRSLQDAQDRHSALLPVAFMTGICGTRGHDHLKPQTCRFAQLAAQMMGGLWRPTNGDEGMVVHAWVPGHHDPIRRSCFADALLYVELFNGRAVVIAAQGVQALQGQPKLILEAPVVEEESKAEDTIPEDEPAGPVMAHTDSAEFSDAKIAPPATSNVAALQEQLEVLRKEKLCKEQTWVDWLMLTGDHPATTSRPHPGEDAARSTRDVSLSHTDSTIQWIPFQTCLLRD
ncbi:hypothetical protein CYMTET_9877 [Cymbomonas tetramitiformis]|uniref:Uncharacterized protein n=1 Tax=Cymbomonas tetramitiformis TaxID=36881 RepID=A0AAE0GQM5_9CHLO|nr:hypothetical protein CYMTET_9877 [Cymbomonas tetramitiformis]